MKVFLLALDGADFRLMENGPNIPNIKKAMQNGVWGKLKSTIPPISGPAWTTMFSGLGPEKHGIYDFIIRTDDDYNFNLIDSSHVQVKRVWEYLAENGLKCISVNTMVTYPVDKKSNQGNIFITGGLTPPDARDYIWPDTIKTELEAKFGPYPVSARGGFALKKGEEKRFVDRIYDNTKKRIEIVKYLMEHKPWDCFVQLVEGLDSWHHEFAPLLFEKDKSNLLYQEYCKYWELIDAFVGYLQNQNNTNLIIVSDHGFRVCKKNLIVNNLLLKSKLLKFRKNPTTILKRLIYNPYINIYLLYRNLSRFIDVSKLKNKLIEGESSGKIVSKYFLSKDNLDLKKSLAYSEGTYGQIYLNNSSDFETVKNALERVKDGGAKVVSKIYNGKDLYPSGVGYPPDIVFDTIENIIPHQRVSGIFSRNTIEPSRQSGNHDYYGVFVCKGPDIHFKGEIKDIKISNVTPLLLKLLNYKIPPFFSAGNLSDICNTVEQKYFINDFAKTDLESVNRDNDGIKDHLRNLGYLS